MQKWGSKFTPPCIQNNLESKAGKRSPVLLTADPQAPARGRVTDSQSRALRGRVDARGSWRRNRGESSSLKENESRQGVWRQTPSRWLEKDGEVVTRGLRGESRSQGAASGAGQGPTTRSRSRLLASERRLPGPFPPQPAASPSTVGADAAAWECLN